MSSNNIPPDVYAKWLLTDGMSEEINCNDCKYYFRVNGDGNCTVRVYGLRKNAKECKDFSM